MNAKAKIDPREMGMAAEEAVTLLKALSNEHRLLILCQLVEGEKSVGQLADFLGIRDSTASQHLSLLRRDRIVTSRRDGQTIWYRISSEPALKIMQVLYESFCVGVKARGEEGLR
ncbi:MAG TPA: metalloregulator ArsR/SmtB family transcription factor [Kiloniellales bacterium]|nr:metalloregulator ArsR/SmtB family transcription factor [Kiloniellales bacterium]